MDGGGPFRTNMTHRRTVNFVVFQTYCVFPHFPQKLKGKKHTIFLHHHFSNFDFSTIRDEGWNMKVNELLFIRRSKGNRGQRRTDGGGRRSFPPP